MTDNANYQKLMAVLSELFQLDQADLDFGIYRIMNAKRDEIIRFLDEDLMPQIKAELSQFESSETAINRKKLEETLQNLNRLKVENPESNSVVKELRAELADAVDVEALENEIFSDLTNFFRRYYKDGDFISLRRYKKDVYAVPYEGEEVKLYWANHDQYYIKTGEYFRDYAFRVDNGKKTVRFKLIDADTEKDNVKAASGKERRFILAENDPVSETDGELTICFAYRPDDAKRTQTELNAEASAAILKILAGKDWMTLEKQDWRRELAAKEATDKNKERTLLDRRLTDYTARNTFDYFIHKDLGGFLRRELDFYIKNEIMHLDDIQDEEEPKVEAYLGKIKALRKIARKIIQFLEQLENFQKKLWLKKKFVVETNYCVTLDRVPPQLYPEIAANDAQREEWVRLFAIDEIKKDIATPGFTKPLTEGFLKANPYLVLDTKFFSEAFKLKLLATFDDLDEQCDGLLIHSENFQALNLLQDRYREQVKCIYIDPPYNTGDGDFPYKDNYKSSSWLSMMSDRLFLIHSMLTKNGLFIAHIDEHENHSLEILVGQVFGASSNIGPMIWDKRNPKGDARGIATQHEYLTWVIKDASILAQVESRLKRPKENASKILDKAAELIRKNGSVNQTVRAAFREWLRDQSFSGGELAYNQIDDNGEVYRLVSMAWPNKNKAPDEYFQPLIHPKTSRPCPIPERGWRNPPATMEALLSAGLILFGQDETTQPTRKYILRENLYENVPSLYYFGGSDDDLQKHLGFFFPNPKPTRLAQYVETIAVQKNELTLDYFAGSGTTGHAVINLNREDGGKRKYILVEMGEHFDTVLKPRIQKVIYSKDWKDGKPVSREGSSHLFKYIRLESYEDTLNNLVLARNKIQADMLAKAKDFRESYMLGYMLDVETRGSDSLLNLDRFADPFSYTLKIATGSAGETKETAIDLVETFNYLIGLTVEKVSERESFIASFNTTKENENKAAVTIEGWKEEKNSHYEIFVKNAGTFKRKAESPWNFQYVEGYCWSKQRAKEKVLVVWRNLTGDIEKDNLMLDCWLKRKQIKTTERVGIDYDIIYVNGDNNLENLRRADETWKVRLIEEEFKRLMFEGKDV